MCCLNVMYVVISGNFVAAYWEIAAHSVYDKFSWYKFRLSFFPPLGLWSRNFFLTVPFLGHCLLVLFYSGPRNVFCSCFDEIA